MLPGRKISLSQTFLFGGCSCLLDLVAELVEDMDESRTIFSLDLR